MLILANCFYNLVNDGKLANNIATNMQSNKILGKIYRKDCHYNSIEQKLLYKLLQVVWKSATGKKVYMKKMFQ